MDWTDGEGVASAAREMRLQGLREHCRVLGEWLVWEGARGSEWGWHACGPQRLSVEAEVEQSCQGAR